MAATGGKPVPFIQWDQASGKFHVSKEGAAVLSSIHEQLAVIVVAGPYRTGKSFLLNRLIGRQGDGFQVGGTVQACTKGIWVWGEPIKTKDRTYIFLDSEGLGSLNQSQSFDTQVFSLGVLLASLFVLNTQGTINEGALEQLELVVQCSKQIKINKESEASVDELAHHFPAFLWVLRDFSLQLETADGRTMTSSQYLEEALEEKPGVNKKVVSKNRIRAAVKSVFKTRDCVTLVRPLLDERQLQKLNQLQYTALR